MGFFKQIWQDLFERGELPEGPEFDGPKDEAPQELRDAENRCPDVKFVKSCRAFYTRRGFLSEVQRNALRYAGTKNRRSNYWSGYEPDVDEG